MKIMAMLRITLRNLCSKYDSDDFDEYDDADDVDVLCSSGPKLCSCSSGLGQSHPKSAQFRCFGLDAVHCTAVACSSGTFFSPNKRSERYQLSPLLLNIFIIFIPAQVALVSHTQSPLSFRVTLKFDFSQPVF